MPASRPRFAANFLQSLAAILAGNAIYFLLLEPRLPAAARHRLFQFDLGLVLDAGICLLCYGLLEFLTRWKSRSKKQD